MTKATESFRYFAGVVFERPVKAEDGVEMLEVPGGKYASYRLVGPYDGIRPAFHRRYGEWLPRSGNVPDDRPRWRSIATIHTTRRPMN